MDELYELLKIKKQMLEDFLEYMSHKSFEENEEEVEKILTYVDEKQVYIDKLLALENKIKAFTKDDTSSIYKEVKAVEAENDSLIRDIIGLDKINLNTMNNLQEKLKLNMKSAKVQKKYSASYSNYAMDVRGSVFDGKQ